MRLNIANARFVIVILLASLQIADVVSTNFILDRGGFELNPLVEHLMIALGAAWWLPKAGIMAVIAAGARRVPFHALSVAAAIYACVVISNISQSLS
jgi:hypothetical protein